MEPESNTTTGLMDILWADPVQELKPLETMCEEEFLSAMDLKWAPNPTRGCSVCFGFRAVTEFLTNNSLVCMIRAHEVQEEGFRDHFASFSVLDVSDSSAISNSGKFSSTSIDKGDEFEEGSDDKELYFPPVITIFSAPNYCDHYTNKGAILHIGTTKKDFRRIQYQCVEHPKPEITESQASAHQFAVISACPYMPIRLSVLVR